jgi:hypothetical protein
MSTTDNEQIEEPPLVECEWCGFIFPEDDAEFTDDQLICGECYEHAATCDDCSALVRNASSLMSVGYNHSVCDSCYDNYGCCEYCDEPYHYDEGPQCNCEDSNSQYVHDWSYKPSAIFHRSDNCTRGRSTLYLGCELEMSNHGCDAVSYGAEKAYNASNNEDLYYLKWDGSVSNGFELVTHPMTLPYIRDNFKWSIADTMSNMGYRSWDADSECGFHIHLSRSAFESRSHIFKFVWFIYANSDALIRYAGRHSTGYARFEPTELQTLTHKAKGGGQDTRYYALNTQNSKTIEMRFMRGSLNRETLIAYCEFADAVFHYTKTLTVNALAEHNGITFNSFYDWSKKQDYPAMNARIARRCTVLDEV